MQGTLKLSPLIKGAITGAIMVALNLLLEYNNAATTWTTYVFYIIYAAGITWTLLAYSRSASYQPTFGKIFGQGFRCFIIVTLVTVLMVWVQVTTHPEQAEKAASLYRQELVAQKDKTPKRGIL